MKRRRTKIAAGLSPQYLRDRARRALVRGRQWIAKAELLYREADKREARADELGLGPWPREFCEACKAGGSCALHPDTPETVAAKCDAAVEAVEPILAALGRYEVNGGPVDAAAVAAAMKHNPQGLCGCDRCRVTP